MITLTPHDPELEVARIRDLLGRTDKSDPLERRVIAHTLNNSRDEYGAPGDKNAASLPHKSRRRRLGVAAAAACLAVTIGVLALYPHSAVATPEELEYSLSSATDAATAPSAQSTLVQLAEIAATASTSAESAEDVHFIQSFGWKLVDDVTNAAVVEPFERSWWLSPDGSWFLEYRKAPPLNASGQIPIDSSFSNELLSSEEIPSGTLADLTTSLSRDPATLREELMTGMNPECTSSALNESACLLIKVSGLADVFVIPADLLSVIWRMLSTDPNVRTLGQAIDRLGRTVEGIATAPVTIDGDIIVTVLLVESATGNIVGSETTTVSSRHLDISSPTVTEFTAIRMTAKVTGLTTPN